MSENLFAACAEHGVTLNAEHAAICERLGDGTILKNLLALVQKFGPAIAAILPQVMADIAAGQYLAAMMLVLSALANLPKPSAA